jgi:acyl-coenzyme A synthetase/AMP-(fatty) acid ligase
LMMGYATHRADLTCGEPTVRSLRTGDHGYIGAHGMLFVTGRADRICKHYGERICLDDIEEFLRTSGPVAAQSRGESIWLFCEVDEQHVRSRLTELAQTYRIPPQSFVLRRVRALPRTVSGKLSYRELGELQ